MILILILDIGIDIDDMLPSTACRPTQIGRGTLVERETERNHFCRICTEKVEGEGKVME